MEELRKLASLLSLLVFVVGTHQLHAQEKFVVFKKQGSPTYVENDSIKSIFKGTALLESHSVSLRTGQELIYVNKAGDCFTINQPGSYSFKDLTAVPVTQETGSFTKKYFTYVWDQFSKKGEQRSKAGAVFRTDQIVLIQPNDSVQIASPEIDFAWQLEAEDSFFLLRDLQTDHITKFGAKGSELTLFVDNQLLKKGQVYQWAISDKKFPDLEKLEFYTFSLLTSEQFKRLKPEIEAITQDLKSLGFTSREIKKMLCSEYKMCY